EAFHQRVPVVVACNAHTIPQERYNARLVRELGLGVTVRHWREIPGAVKALRLEPGRLPRYPAGLRPPPPQPAGLQRLRGNAPPVVASTPPPLTAPASPAADPLRTESKP